MIRAIKHISGEGFRIFFLAAGLFAIVSVVIWEWWLGAQAFGLHVAELPFADAAFLWHAHEMVFGYACAAVGGFFLTAAPNWTGGPAARRAFLVTLALVWLAGRLAIWWSGALPAAAVAAVDLAFLPLVGVKLAVLLARRPKPQNVMLLGLLLLIWSGNVMVHLEWTGVLVEGVEPGLRVGLFGLAAIIAVIGGRVTPAFTRNAMTKAGAFDRLPVSRRRLDMAGIVSAIALPLLIGVGASDLMIAAAALAAGVAQALRLAGWRGLWTRSEPLLWSLHLGFAMLAVGYIAYGLAALGVISEVSALHVVGIGAVGGMTLAVMSRAILGHTGRALRASRPVALAFTLIAASTALRASGALDGLEWYNIAVIASGFAWIAAFSAFIWSMWPALSGPRVESQQP